MVERCYVAASLDEALKIRKETGAHVLAGGTDLMVQFRQGTGISPVFPFPVVIISSVRELDDITAGDDGTVTIGALAVPARIAASQLVPYPVRAAAARMGAPALRNSATIGGNIGNASPKGDLPQPLIMLDARVVLTSLDGEREMLLDDFILGSKKTALRDDEIISAVRIPPVSWSYVFYRKIGTRRANAISKLSLSALMRFEDGRIADFRAASGASGPKVIRSREAENLLKGLDDAEARAELPAFLDAWNEALSPHAMPQYRRNTTRRMLEHFITSALEHPQSEIII